MRNTRNTTPISAYQASLGVYVIQLNYIASRIIQFSSSFLAPLFDLLRKVRDFFITLFYFLQTICYPR
ncbi:hypothetical protein ATO4_21732 [Aurantimonas sp. 22II-16-19i]|nr:hypothetical protein ATO4_21732 [Aurantimonas sp. 22II-16-19i]